MPATFAEQCCLAIPLAMVTESVNVIMCNIQVEGNVPLNSVRQADCHRRVTGIASPNS